METHTSAPSNAYTPGPGSPQPDHSRWRRFWTSVVRFTWTVPLRNAFDRSHLAPVAIVGVAAALTGLALWLMQRAAGACASPPVSLIRLEVAFRASRFAELLTAEGACRGAVIRSFQWDLAFIATYPVLLAALYLWAERWRRVTGPDGPKPDPTSPYWFRGRFFVAAPIIAGLLDAIPENAFLWPAAMRIPEVLPYRGSGAVAWLVAIGSIGSALKWALLLAWAWGICSELLSGPRGAVIRRTRFSVLAVLLGALPLLIVAQGQDILQRLAEGAHPLVRVFFSVLAIGLAGYTVWRSARALVQFKLDADPAWAGSPWAKYYAEDIPRILGVAMPAVAGAAFANEAGDLLWFFGVSVMGGLTLLVPGRWLRPVGRAIVRFLLLPRRWLSIDPFADRIGAAVVACAIAAAVFLFHRGSPWAARGEITDQARAAKALGAAAWMCYTSGWLLYLYVYFRRARELVKYDSSPLIRPAEFEEKLEVLRAWSYDVLEFEQGSQRRFVRPVLILSAVSVVALVVFARWAVPVGRVLGPLWVLSIFAINIVLFGGVAVWVHARYRVPVVRLALALSIVCGLWNENHDVAVIPGSARGALDARQTVHARLDEWLAAPTHAGRDTVPVVLVAAAGGGLRAAYWTATALATIQDLDSTFSADVFAISGVSGGSVGAALFTAIARDDGLAPGHRRLASCSRHLSHDDSVRTARAPYTACVRAFMRDDFLSPLLAKMLGPDLVQRFLPVAISGMDRSRALEGSWDVSYSSVVDSSNALSEGLLKLGQEPAVRSSIPSLVLNSTHVETGKRYLATPLRFDGTFTDAGDVLGLLDRDLPVSSAAHNSARFTYVSPAGHLDRGNGFEYGRVVDGGYFENSGLVTLREIYDAVETWQPADTTRRRATLVPVVVYLCNDPTTCGGESASAVQHVADSLAHVASTWANEVLGPVRAVLNARDARAALARSQLQATLGNRFIQLNVCRDSVSPTSSGEVDSARTEKARDRVVSPPLGWLLSALARDWMDGSIRPRISPSDGACRRSNVAHVAELLRKERYVEGR